MFTTPCFIRKNTPELREKLDSLGHKLNHGKVCGKCLCVFKTEDSDEWRYAATPLSDINSMPNFDNAIDCGENEELFLATAALCNDSDKHQLFFHNNDIECEYPIECIHDKFHLIQVDEYLSKYKDRKNEYHKATVEELIKHFK